MTSAPLQSALTSLQQNDYVTLAILTAVGYDYVLTFSKEIEHIWTKPWTRVSTLFILVRYFGLGSLIIPNLLGSQVLDVVNGWLFLIFLGAAEIVMILRVWVIYNQSRAILVTLLVFFLLGIISTTLAVAVASIPGNLSATTIQILDSSICAIDSVVLPTWNRVAAVMQITHGAMTCMLAVSRFVSVSLRTHHGARQWQINRYIGLLVRQGIFYFIAMFVFSLVNVLNASGKFPTGDSSAIPLYILEYVPVYTLTPRLIMNIREMYARDIRGGIDTGFGLSSYNGSTVGTTIDFADSEQNEELVEVGDMLVEVRTTQLE